MRFLSLSLSLLLAATSVQAADNLPGLAPGKPAGIGQAQYQTRDIILLVSGTLVVVTGFAFLIAATQHDKSTPLSIAGGNVQLGGTGSGTTTTPATTTSSKAATTST